MLWEIFRLLVFPGFLFAMIASLVFEWLDRKLYARMQNRMGPTYTGPFGLLQPLADVFKLMGKEDITPKGVDSLVFTLSPVLSFAVALTACLLLPVTGPAGVVSFEGDLIFAVALLTLSGILVIAAGYSSRNRYAAVGAERAALQLIAYEIPLTLSILGVAIKAGSLSVSGVVKAQATWPFVFSTQVLGFIVYILAVQAELERKPFDIPEAEQELVAGWLVEFSGRKLAFFRMSEDLKLFFLSGLGAALYLGGPLWLPIPPALNFLAKSLFVLLLLSLIKAAIARLRIDITVRVFWKLLIPLAVIQLILAAWGW